jgi:hypothetical protein
MHPVLRGTEDDCISVSFAGQLGELPGGIAVAVHQLHG